MMKKLRSLAALYALGWTLAIQDSKRKMDDAANAQITHVGVLALSIVGIILAAVIGLQVINSLFPTYASAVHGIADSFNNTTWGNGTANVISPIFGLLAALAGLIAIVGLVLLAVNLYKRSA
jgi:hypothetical protein